MDDDRARQIGGLLGPTLVAVTISELPFVQPHLYDGQIASVVYLSGALLFVAGLATVRAHNVWRRDWTVLVTVVGWLALGLGLVRLFGAAAYRATVGEASSPALVAIELSLCAIGAVITVQSYRRR